MKTHTILPMTLFIGLLGGAAGYAADPASRCKKLHVENHALYFVDVTYKKCPGGEVTTERVSSINGNRDFSIDPLIKSADELKIVGVGLINDYLWHSNSADSNWDVICYGSLTHPVCTGTPGDTSKCKPLHVKNQDMPRIQVEYQECGTKMTQTPQLDWGEEDTYYVEPGANLQIDLIGGAVAGRIWPESLSDGGIGNGKTITCQKSSRFCDAKPMVK